MKLFVLCFIDVMQRVPFADRGCIGQPDDEA